MFKYSEKLLKETISVFKKEDHLDVSPEIACEYLDNLGGLFLAFTKKSESN